VRREAWVALVAAAVTVLSQPSNAAHAKQPEPPAAQPAPPIPTPARMVLMGDSVAVSIGPALVNAAAAQGIFLHNASRSGCSQINGIATTVDSQSYPWEPGCANGNVAFQRDILGTYRPQLVVWLSTWESVDRVLGGEWVHFATFRGNPRIVAEIDAAVGRLTAGGARLVFAIPAPVPPGTEAEDHDAMARLGSLSTVLREYARQHADRVFVVEMGELLCPDGPPCPETINGAVPRPDGMHFDDPASAAWVADWLVDRVLAPVTPAPVAPGRVNASVA
jgi:SGNH domain (fused to AT3 domains)